MYDPTKTGWLLLLNSKVFLTTISNSQLWGDFNSLYPIICLDKGQVHQFHKLKCSRLILLMREKHHIYYWRGEVVAEAWEGIYTLAHVVHATAVKNDWANWCRFLTEMSDSTFSSGKQKSLLDDLCCILGKEFLLVLTILLIVLGGKLSQRCLRLLSALRPLNLILASSDADPDLL